MNRGIAIVDEQRGNHRTTEDKTDRAVRRESVSTSCFKEGAAILRAACGETVPYLLAEPIERRLHLREHAPNLRAVLVTPTLRRIRKQVLVSGLDRLDALCKRGSA